MIEKICLCVILVPPILVHLVYRNFKVAMRFLTMIIMLFSQVWHYCDLNGGKSSFLCPNGTIFSQVALTCDWWFNVKCETTTQLYVLNERLYKYILPIMPKFPEDFTGPEVDRYLELKFKEMEAKLKEKKLKKQQEEKEKEKQKEKLKDKQQTQEKENE